MARGRMRSKIDRLEVALAGRFSDHHALMCTAMLDRIDQANKTIDMLTARIVHLLNPHEAAVTLWSGYLACRFAPRR